jgi:hypothetical protein
MQNIGINSGAPTAGAPGGATGPGSLAQPGMTEIGNKFIAEKMVSQNLKDNVNDMQTELLKISSQVKEMIQSCDSRLNEVMR